MGFLASKHWWQTWLLRYCGIGGFAKSNAYAIILYMADYTHEQTINTALGEILAGFGQDWRVKAERIGQIFSDGGRPDVLIEKQADWPVVLEAEVENHHQAEGESRGRLGKQLASSGATIEIAVALVYPEILRTKSDEQLRQAIHSIFFEYAVFSRRNYALDKASRLDSLLGGLV